MIFLKNSKINNYITSVSLIVTSVFLNINNVLAQSFKEISGLEKTADKAGFLESLKNISGEGLIIQVINLILTFVGVAFLILMIYGGISWMTAAGNESNVEKAKKIITSSIIGLIVVFSAYVISYFIVGFFSSQTIR